MAREAGEKTWGSQVVICSGFHLIDRLQSQWGLCVPLFGDGLLFVRSWGRAGGIMTFPGPISFERRIIPPARGVVH